MFCSVGRQTLKRVFAIFAVSGVAAIAGTTATAGAAPSERNCGEPPGQGAFSYTTTVGVTCQTAVRISFRVTRRFCARHHDCRYGLHTSPLLVRHGRVSYRGWKCHVREGYEFNDVRCRKGDMSFHHESAA
jgi:hypothetical protein